MKLSGSTKKLLIRIALFLLYLIVGAAVFMAIEKNFEQEERENTLEFIKRVNRLNATKTFNSSDDLKSFLRELKKALRYGYDIEYNRLNAPKWSYMNSFYFVGNIVTTIGYGHMVPETTWGRLFCIVYALFGIPLTALMLRSVGNRITEWIIAMIKQFDRRVYNRETENAELKSAVIAFGLLWLIILLPAIAISKIETNWDYMGSVYYCFITFSTIGFGDLVPISLRADNKVETQVFLEFGDLLYLVIGLAIMSSVVVAISGVIETKTQMLVDPMEAFRRIDMENLNSVAVKKLGLKMNGPDNLNSSMGHQTRRASEIPNGLMNRRGSRFPNWEDQRLQERNSADRIDHVGPAPVISIAKQPSCSRNSNESSKPSTNGTIKKNDHLVVPVELNSSSAFSPSISPQPPPVFKSNKVTPVDGVNSDDQDGIVNDICETVDEAMFSVEGVDLTDDEESKASGITDESSVTGVYDLQNEHEKNMSEQSNETFRLKGSTHWDDNA